MKTEISIDHLVSQITQTSDELKFDLTMVNKDNFDKFKKKLDCLCDLTNDLICNYGCRRPELKENNKTLRRQFFHLEDSISSRPAKHFLSLLNMYPIAVKGYSKRLKELKVDNKD